MSEPGEKGTTIINKRCRKLLKTGKYFVQSKLNKTVKTEMRIVQVAGNINNGVLYF